MQIIPCIQCALIAIHLQGLYSVTSNQIEYINQSKVAKCLFSRRQSSNTFASSLVTPCAILSTGFLNSDLKRSKLKWVRSEAVHTVLYETIVHDFNRKPFLERFWSKAVITLFSFFFFFFLNSQCCQTLSDVH